MFDNPSMYTEAGNRAVRKAVAKIEALVRDNPTIRNRDTLSKAASPILRAVGKRYSEIWDTEPRGWIADHLDAICKANGWSYQEWDAYEW